MTISLERLKYGSSPAHQAAITSANAAAAASSSPAARRRDSKPEQDTQWALPALALALCLFAAGSMFAHGTAALAWLIAAFVILTGAVPGYLIILQLRSYRHER